MTTTQATSIMQAYTATLLENIHPVPPTPIPNYRPYCEFAGCHRDPSPDEAFYRYAGSPDLLARILNCHLTQREVMQGARHIGNGCPEDGVVCIRYVAGSCD